MDLAELAEALGLPKDSPADAIYKAAASVVLDGKKSKDQLSTFSEQLSGHGLKLEQGKLVKVAAANTPPPADESPREKELRERLERIEGEGAKSRLSSAKAEAERFIKEGKVPAAVAEKLERVFALADGAESLALSQDGTAVVRRVYDVAGAVRDVLNAMPSIKGSSLSQLAPFGGDDAKKKAEALSKKGREVAQRVSGRKPEPAGKE